MFISCKVGLLYWYVEVIWLLKRQVCIIQLAVTYYLQGWYWVYSLKVPAIIYSELDHSRLCSSLIISYLFLLIYLGTYSESHISVFPHQWVVQEDNHILACKDDCKGCLVACKLQGRYGTLEKLVPWWDSLWNRITTGTLYICACTAY